MKARMSRQSSANAPTPIPTSAPVERLEDAVAGLVFVAAGEDVGEAVELVMLTCPGLGFVVDELNVVDEGMRAVVVADT